MAKEYRIEFPKITSAVFEIEMMDLDGSPLFFHSVKNLQELYPECYIWVEGKNQKVIDYCKEYGIEIINKKQISQSCEIINAYQPFLYKQSKYSIFDQYRNLEVTDLQSYLFAVYIINCLRRFSISEQQKKEKSDIIIAKDYSNEQICFIGDSLIEYFDIQEINGLKVFNVGVGDLTTSECLEWIVSKLQLEAFRAFYLIIGSNDLKYKIKKDTIVSNVIRLIILIRKINNKALIIYTPVPNVYRRWDRYNDEINELNIALRDAIKNEVLILDTTFLNNQYGELDKNNTIDGLHFNNRAYKQLKNQLEKLIK